MTEYNKGHQTECLQTLTIVQDIIETNLAGHPAIIKTMNKQKVEYLQEIIADIYQEVGELGN
jgi:hypothetical protein